MNNKEILKEELADIEHQRWADWQSYLHDKCARCPDGLLISNSDVKHWERQIETTYSELSEKEKDSDREQVDRYFYVIENFIKEKLEERDKEWLLRFKKYEKILDNIDSFEWEWNKGKDDRDKFNQAIEDIKNKLNK